MITKNLLILSALVFGLSSLSSLAAESSNPGYVYHLVAFRYKPAVSAAMRREIAERFLALKDQCRDRTGAPYVVALEHGRFSSPEGADREVATNYPDSYIVTFKSEADRNYYVGRPFSAQFDPAHDAFKTFVGPYLDVLRDGNGKPVLDGKGQEQIKGVLVYDLTARKD